MPNVMMSVGAVLAALGVVAYIASDRASVTALIPTFFGLPLAALGLAARQPRWRTPAVLAAALLGVGGLLGSLRGVAQLPALLGGTVERPFAVVVQVLMAAICAALLVACLRFIRASRATSGPALRGGR